MEEILLWSLFAACLAKKMQTNRNKHKRRTKWSRQWLLKRRQLSHVILLRELEGEPDDWRNYLRMDVETYNYLLTLVTPRILRKDTCMRRAISPHERLTVTLRFLATGRTYKDLEFSTAISKQALSEIIPNTCEAIYAALKNDFMKFPKTEDDWMRIARDFQNKWQFPHCLGAIDGKHVRIVPPKESGSFFYNYKKTNSVVLMAVANANCEFVYCDVGTNGRVSDGGVLQNTKFYELLISNTLNIPQPERIANSNEIMEYVFVGDDAFAIRKDLLKPYRHENLSEEEKIFNYRLSRARRVIENTFGILASRFRIFHTAINLKLENIDIVVLTCCVLHNFLRRRNPQLYTPVESMDRENLNDCTVEFGERCDGETMHALQRGRSGQISDSAKTVRDQYKQYFSTVGAVPWQNKSVF